MTLDLLLRALRKCEIEVNDFGWMDSEIGPLDKTEARHFKSYARLADKIHNKIVERFEEVRVKAFMYDHGLGEEDMKNDLSYP